MAEIKPKLTDITIKRVFEVCCELCGGTVIDAPRRYKTALESRREHFAYHKPGGARDA